MDGSFKSGSGVRALAFVSCFGMVIALHSVVTDLLACKLALNLRWLRCFLGYFYWEIIRWSLGNGISQLSHIDCLIGRGASLIILVA